jgi:hypothetical protein
MDRDARRHETLCYAQPARATIATKGTIMSIIKDRNKSVTAALGAAAAAVAAPAVVIPLLLFGPGIAPAYADDMGPTPAPVPSPSRPDIVEPLPWFLEQDIKWAADYVELTRSIPTLPSAPPAPSATDVIAGIIEDVGKAVAPDPPDVVPFGPLLVLPPGESPH